MGRTLRQGDISERKVGKDKGNLWVGLCLKR